MNKKSIANEFIEEHSIDLGFEILIDENFASLSSDKAISPKENKNVISIINSFEDKQWLQSRFDNFVWDNIAETALSVRERKSLVGKAQTELVQAAKNLRLTDAAKDEKGQGSELAEIVLYGIMKRYFGALPVVPKIFYKQNVQDNAKGADSVHIVIAKGMDDFTLWFGEAKFYNNIENVRLDAIVKSVDASLQTDKLKKENSIITNVSDLEGLISDETLLKNIQNVLSHKTSIDDIKPKLHVPILLIHECEITQTQQETTEEYKEAIKRFHKERAEAYFKKQIEKCSGIHKYAAIQFHIILLPVPNKKPIVDKFIKTVQFYKGP